MNVWWKKRIKGVLRRSRRLPFVEGAARAVLNEEAATPSVPFYEIRDVSPIRPQASMCPGLRLNLFVPSINAAHSFGGIRTAVRIFEQLGDIVESTSDVRLRMITNTRTFDESVVNLAKWRRLDSQDSDHRYQILELEDATTRTIPFSKHDVLVATWWATAYRATRLRAWQEMAFGGAVPPLIYIVQDFEPGFYPWSSRYAYAEETYLEGANTIAIFNTSLLRRYFEKRGYSFLKMYHFEPRIDSVLKAHLKPNATKQRRLLVYGRPSSPRNCFEVICAGLREWANTSRDAHKWTIVSAGEKHPNVPLGNGLEIRSLGKLSLPAYAEQLNECAVGVSLMLSPHPSYPPLEMAHSGILTITNAYDEKNLSLLHDNIYSMTRIAPEEVAKVVERCVGLFEVDHAVGSKGMNKASFFLREEHKEECLYEVAQAIRIRE